LVAARDAASVRSFASDAPVATGWMGGTRRGVALDRVPEQATSLRANSDVASPSITRSSVGSSARARRVWSSWRLGRRVYSAAARVYSAAARNDVGQASMTLTWPTW